MLYLHGAHCVMCMKIHCYSLLNIKHGASQLYWGRPPNTTMRPTGEGGWSWWRGRQGPLFEASGGLQLSSAGTECPRFELSPQLGTHTRVCVCA